jgi:hypothetical protein
MAMNDRRTAARSILDASPHAARWAWMVNGVLFAIGASVSTFVYLLGRGGGEFTRVGPAADASTESVESHLFSFPFFQLVLFLVPLIMDLNWRRFQLWLRQSEQLQRARDARYQGMDTVILYFGVCFMLVIAGLLILVMALSAASWVYTRSSIYAG